MPYGFWNQASEALPQGMNLGMQGMAEAQRRKELEEQTRRQMQAQAFAQMMGQQNFQADESYRQAQLGQGQQQIDEGRRQFDAQAPTRQATIQNLLERRAPTEAEFYWNQMPPEQRDEMLRNYIQFKFKPPTGMAGGSSIDPGEARAKALGLETQNAGNQYSGLSLSQPRLDSLSNYISTGNFEGGQQQQSHPLLMKMVQDGNPKEDILSDYDQNPNEYMSQGITRQMIEMLP